MATANPITESRTESSPPSATLLVSIAAMPPEQVESVFASLTASFPAAELVIVTPNETAGTSYSDLRILPARANNTVWPLAAADFSTACQLAKEQNARAVLMLGPGSDSLSHTALRDLANAVLSSHNDLVVPYYTLPPNAGMVNSAILYPLTRSLFASPVRYPLAIDLCMSIRMAERLASAADRLAALNRTEAIMWPTNEALVAGLSIDEVAVGPRMLPQPAEPNINAILSLVTGSLFAEIETKATYWQRPRRTPSEHQRASDPLPADGNVDIASMVESFRLAFTNLQEIWSLVLAPNTLVGLKRLSVVEPAAFRMPESLWTRVVFDFLIAYRLRTINRGHLLGALIPLYLAWVAGHINVIASGISPETHIEAVATAFEADKQYIVSRWRWPDRFNS